MLVSKLIIRSVLISVLIFSSFSQTWSNNNLQDQLISNSGKRFAYIELLENDVATFSLNKNSTKFYTACCSSGISVINIPTNPNSLSVVTIINDSGPSSLRDAIEEANLQVGKDIIKFNNRKSDQDYNIGKTICAIRSKSLVRLNIFLLMKAQYLKVNGSRFLL